MLDNTLPREHSTPAMDQVAPQGARIDTPREPVTEAGQNALFQSLVRHVARPGIKSLPPGDIKKLLKEGSHLASRDHVDAKPAAGLQPELVFRGVTPCAHQNPKITGSFLPKQVFPEPGNVAIDIAQ